VHPEECQVAFSSCFLRAHDEGAESEQQKHGSTNLNAEKKKHQQLLGKYNILIIPLTYVKTQDKYAEGLDRIGFNNNSIME
jgi:hypothetical protein